MRDATVPTAMFSARRRIIVAGAVLAGFAAFGLAVHCYGSDGKPAPDPTGTAQVPEGAARVSGDLGISFVEQPRTVPDLSFVDGEGHAMSLGDFRGRPVLLNIWATWCVPCRAEMPALDRLQAGFDKSQFLVLPLSIDRKGSSVVKPFYEELGLKALGIYVDQSGKAASALDAVGVPTTLLIDRDGREVGRKIGPTEWDSPEVIALLREHLGLSDSAQKVSP